MLPYLEEIARREIGVDSEEFLRIMALAQSFPGAMGINGAAIIGYRMGGWKGALASVAGVTVPSVICASLLFYLLSALSSSPWFIIGTKSLKAAVVGIILAMSVNLAHRSWRGLRPVLIGLTALLLFYRLPVSPILILLGAGICGYFFLSPREAK